MKSNKVRMNISRDMHEWFKSIDGDTNDERMQRVIDDVAEYKELLIKNHKLEMSLQESRKVGREWLGKLLVSQGNNAILKGLLGLSMAVSTISVSYLAYVQGWFL